MPALPYAWAWPVLVWSATGRRRYRRQNWTGKLILQVELSGPEMHHITGTPSGRNQSYWRDATLDDLLPIDRVA